MDRQREHDSTFEALVEIKKSLDEKVNVLAEQIRRAQLECLEDVFRQQKDALAECLGGIDQQLITLSVYIEEYRDIHRSLGNLNEKIPELGGTSPVMPEAVAGDSLMEILAGRLDCLKTQGKIKDR